MRKEENKDLKIVIYGDDKEVIKEQTVNRIIVRRIDLKRVLGLINFIDVENILNDANLDNLKSPENVTVASEFFHKFPEVIDAINLIVVYNFNELSLDDLDYVDMSELINIYINIAIAIIGKNRISRFIDSTFDSLISKFSEYSKQ